MKKKKYDIIVLSGGFDPVHVGHLRMMQAASQMADKVIVGCNTDEWLRNKKGYAFMPYKQRREIVEGFESVDEVLYFNDDDGTAKHLLEKVKNLYPTAVTAFGNGGDRGKSNTPEQLLCEELGMSMVWGLGGEEKPQSSSWLVNSAIEQMNESVDSAVEHPSHYNQGNTEVIDIIAEQGHAKSFCYGNAMKYIMRAPHKNNEKEDLEKAVWYLKWLIENE